MPAEDKKQTQTESRTLKTLLEWKAPARPFKRKSKEFFSTVLTIAALIVIILAFLKEWFAILAVIAFVFLVFVTGKTPPEEVEHKITTRGIVTGGTEFRWEQLGRFWFEEKDGQKILCVENFTFPHVLIMLINEADEKKLKEILLNYLPQENPSQTWIDKASHWLTTKISLE
jgi:Ca2+/Na+ antiporter